MNVCVRGHHLKVCPLCRLRWWLMRWTSGTHLGLDKMGMKTAVSHLFRRRSWRSILEALCCGGAGQGVQGAVGGAHILPRRFELVEFSPNHSHGMERHSVAHLVTPTRGGRVFCVFGVQNRQILSSSKFVLSDLL